MTPNFRRLLLRRAARLFDLAVVSLTFIAAVAVSSGYLNWPTLASFLSLRIKVENILIFCGYLIACSAIFTVCGLYSSHRLSPWTRHAREILLATSLVTVLFFLLPRQMGFATREFLLLFWLINFATLTLARIVGYQLLYYARSRDRNLRNLIIVGEGSDALALANRIERDATLGYRVLRIIDTNGSQKAEAQAPSEVGLG